MTNISSNYTSGYVPDLGNYSTSSSANTYNPSFSAESYDTLELSQQESTKKNNNKMLAWVAAAGVGIAATLLLRKKIPGVGKYFAEDGGGIRQMFKDVRGKFTSAVGKAKKPQIQSFKTHDDAIKAAEENLTKVMTNPKSVSADVGAAQEAVNAARAAEKSTHKVFTDDIAKTMLERDKAAASGIEDLSAYTSKIDEAKTAYVNALTEGGRLSKVEADGELGKVAKTISDQIKMDKDSVSSIKNAAQAYSKNKTGTTKAFVDRVNYLVNKAESNGTKKLSTDEVNKIKSQVNQEFRTAFAEIRNAKKQAAT